MNIDDIDYFAKVASTGNIGRAAEALGLTQPTLSRALGRLETLAGQRLFTRHAKGVALTPAGEALLKRASRIQLEYEDAMRELQQMRSGQLGVVRLGFSPTVDDSLVVSALRQMMLERTAARVKLTEGLAPQLLDLLLDGQLDLALAVALTPLSSDLQAVPLYDDELYVVADREHPLVRKQVASWLDAAVEPWLLPSPPNRVRLHLDKQARDVGVELNVRVESQSPGINQLHLLRGTRMLSLCGAWTLPSLRQMGLQMLPLERFRLQRQVAILQRSGSYVSPLTQRLIELLQAHAKDRWSAPQGMHGVHEA